jgi:hypothetical protein
MKTITKILAVLLLSCSVVFGQSKKDIADFKIKFPKTEENTLNNVSRLVGVEIQKGNQWNRTRIIKLKQPHFFVNDGKPLQTVGKYWYGQHPNWYEYGLTPPKKECRVCNGSYHKNDHCCTGVPALFTKTPKENCKCSAYHKQVLESMPSDLKKEATEKLEKDTIIHIFFVVIDNKLIESLPKCRTNIKQNIYMLPLRFQKMYEVLHEKEMTKLRKKFNLQDVWVYCKIETGNVRYGWVKMKNLTNYYKKS